jgi:hypothetical protein
VEDVLKARAGMSGSEGILPVAQDLGPQLESPAA